MTKVTAEHINDSNVCHAINHMTLVLALVEKGVLSCEDLERARSKATHCVDQAWAEKMTGVICQKH